MTNHWPIVCQAASTVTVPASTVTTNNPPASCTQPGPNLVVDGSFEASGLGWTRGGSSIIINGQGAEDGSFCYIASIGPGRGPCTVLQAITGTKSGATYVLSFWTRVPVFVYPGATYSWSASYAGNTIVSGTFSGVSATWTQHIVNIPAAGDGILEFFNAASSSVSSAMWELDNVQFFEAPGQ